MTNEISAIIIENNKEAQDYLISLVEKVNLPITILGKFMNIKDSIKGILSLNPEIVFMDIELDDGNAFEILDSVKNHNFEVIFVTGFNDYIEKAMDYYSFHYLTKPINFNRLETILIRYHKLQDRFFTKNKYELYKQFNTSSKLLVNKGNSHVLIDIKDIIKCEASGNYTFFYIINNEKHLASKSLKFYEELLFYKGFFRVNRSEMINTDYIESIYKKEAIILKNKEKLIVSVRNRSNLMNLIKNYS